MGNISKKYVSEVKRLFPFLGKEEKDYLKNLEKDIEDFLTDNNIEELSQLHDTYGLPIDVVDNYYSTLKISAIVEKARRTKYTRAFTAAILAVAVFSVSLFFCLKNEELKIIDEQKIVICEKVITEY